MTIVDSVVRLLPGYIEEEQRNSESFFSGLLDYPQYTRPADFKGKKVPEVLLSGNHQAIKKWREQEAKKITEQKRPDLLKGRIRKP